jgi:hypothetical protein
MSMYTHRDEECTLPLNMYSLFAALLILLIGLAVASILFFGREHPVLEADWEENDNRELNNTTDSSASAEMLLMAVRPKSVCCSWLSLRVVFQVTFLLHIFAFIWACIGVFWHSIFPDMECNEDIRQVRARMTILLHKLVVIILYYCNKLYILIGSCLIEQNVIYCAIIGGNSK